MSETSSPGGWWSGSWDEAEDDPEPPKGTPQWGEWYARHLTPHDDPTEPVAVDTDRSHGWPGKD